MPFNDAYSIDFEQMSGTITTLAATAFDLAAPSIVSQSTAREINASVNVFTVVVTGGACRLPNTNKQIEILNRGQAVLVVYPTMGWTIESNLPNASVGVPPGGGARFLPRVAKLKWYVR